MCCPKLEKVLSGEAKKCGHYIEQGLRAHNYPPRWLANCTRSIIASEKMASLNAWGFATVSMDKVLVGTVKLNDPCSELPNIAGLARAVNRYRSL